MPKRAVKTQPNVKRPAKRTRSNHPNPGVRQHGGADPVPRVLGRCPPNQAMECATPTPPARTMRRGTSAHARTGSSTLCVAVVEDIQQPTAPVQLADGRHPISHAFPNPTDANNPIFDLLCPTGPCSVSASPASLATWALPHPLSVQSPVTSLFEALLALWGFQMTRIFFLIARQQNYIWVNLTITTTWQRSVILRWASLA